MTRARNLSDELLEQIREEEIAAAVLEAREQELTPDS